MLGEQPPSEQPPATLGQHIMSPDLPSDSSTRCTISPDLPWSPLISHPTQPLNAYPHDAAGACSFHRAEQPHKAALHHM